MYKQYNYLALGQRIKEERVKKGFSKEYIHNKIGISTKTLEKIEKGDVAFLNNLSMLASFYDVTVEELVTGYDGRFCRQFCDFNYKKRKFIYDISELLSKSKF